MAHLNLRLPNKILRIKSRCGFKIVQTIVQRITFLEEKKNVQKNKRCIYKDGLTESFWLNHRKILWVNFFHKNKNLFKKEQVLTAICFNSEEVRQRDIETERQRDRETAKQRDRETHLLKDISVCCIIVFRKKNS